jgi:RNA polymerase sigma-70 factor (ECF subfamily)
MPGNSQVDAQQNDAELVEAACQGNLASFGELYRRHYRMAVGLACSHLADRHLAEDAAQEAFATACRRLSTLRDGRRFAEWLGTICRRTARRMARSRRNDAPFNHESVSTSQNNEAAATDIRVRQALERLSAAEREIVLLHYFSGLTHEEIGRMLGRSTQAVHGRLQRARRHLARELSLNAY